MSRTFHHGERRIRVRGITRDPADLRRLARALIELAQAQAEAEAEHDNKHTNGTRQRRKRIADPPADTAGIEEEAA